MLVLLHLVYLKSRAGQHGVGDSCWAWDEDVLVPGIIA